MPSYHSKRCRRYRKDQFTIVKFLHTSGGHQSTDELRNLRNRILEMVDSLVDDGGVKANMNNMSRTPRYLNKNWHGEPLGVVYSLNKKKRWLLPDRILHAVEQLRRFQIMEKRFGCDYKSGQDIDFDISYLGREIQFDYGRGLTNIGIYSCPNYRKHDSVFYASSSVHQRYKTKVKNSFSNETDLKESAMEREHVDHKEQARSRRRRGHNQHFRDVQRKDPKHRPLLKNNASADIQEVPQIHYEVCYPHDSPYMFYYHYNCKYQFKDAKNTKRKRKYNYNLKWDLSHSSDNTKYIQYDCIDSISDTYFEESAETDQDTSQFYSTTYADLLKLWPPKGPTKGNYKPKMSKSDNVASYKVNPASSEPVKMHGKNKVIYVDERCSKHDNNNASYDVLSEIARPSAKQQSPSKATISLCFKVKIHSVLQTVLKSEFGDAYTEGLAIPRRFLINVSSYISNSNQGFQNCGDSEDNLWMVFVLYGENNFEKKTECELESQTCDINITFHGIWGDIKLSEIQAELSTFATSKTPSVSVISLVKHVASFLVNNSSFTGKEVSSTLVENLETLKYQHISELNEWNIMLYNSSTACKLMSKLLLLNSSRKTKKQTSVSECSQVTDTNESVGIMCDICLSESPFTVLEATALSTCKHWFCNRCWKNHLTEGITNGSVFLECPSCECHNLIDHATLFSLVGHELYCKYWHHIQRVKIDLSPNWKWCPQSGCDIVVHIPAVKKPSHLVCVQCLCSFDWCFDCQQEPHWPVSCDMTKSYLKVAEEREDKDRVFYVMVKRCPSCEYPLTKDASCPYVLCPCGFGFCYLCLRPWGDHVGSLAACSKYKVKLTNLEVQYAPSVRVREEYFMKAMEYRKRKKQLSHRFCKVRTTDQLTHGIVKVVKNNSTNKPISPTDHPLFLSSIKQVTKQGCFLYEANHFLEFTFVFVSQTTNRIVRRLRHHISLLIFLEEQFSKLIIVPNKQPVEEWITSLNKATEDLKQQVVRVGRIITECHQRDLHS